ncbi:MAG: M20 family metallo-hydrolase [Bacteroidia bacterium]
MNLQEPALSVEQQCKEAVDLLQQLIAIPSYSKEESGSADLIEAYLSERDVEVHRIKNNVWARNRYYDENKPTILLNSHHDTVKPNAGYTIDPFGAMIDDGKLYGLGSNDAGGALVSLMHTFLFFNQRSGLRYNLVFAATAEEEISGSDGIQLILPSLGKIDFAIVGEPTQMNMAVAEKGLMVLDCVVRGKSGHAAREEGENAIYKALADIEWFRNFRFPRQSEFLGPVKMSVTMIKSGSQHNVVPDRCEFTVDVRTTDAYTNFETFRIIQEHVGCEVVARSLRLSPSAISPEHPLVKAGISLGRTCYGSPTLSDQALMEFESVKIGPGDSARSHAADEFIYLDEITEGIRTYIKLLEQLV